MSFMMATNMKTLTGKIQPPKLHNKFKQKANYIGEKPKILRMNSMKLRNLKY